MSFGSFAMSVKTQRRPAPGEEAYQPKFARGAEVDPASVPERLRNVRLHRRRVAKMERTPILIQVVIAVSAAAFFVVAIHILGLLH